MQQLSSHQYEVVSQQIRYLDSTGAHSGSQEITATVGFWVCHTKQDLTSRDSNNTMQDGSSGWLNESFHDTDMEVTKISGLSSLVHVRVQNTHSDTDFPHQATSSNSFVVELSQGLQDSKLLATATLTARRARCCAVLQPTRLECPTLTRSCCHACDTTRTLRPLLL
jgi:hypothetical protein